MKKEKKVLYCEKRGDEFLATYADGSEVSWGVHKDVRSWRFSKSLQILIIKREGEGCFCIDSSSTETVLEEYDFSTRDYGPKFANRDFF